LPELPEVESVRRTLAPVITSARFDRVVVARPDLRVPFPNEFAKRLTGQTVAALNRRGKYLLAELSSGETLVMHLGMSGWFRTDQQTLPHDHVVFHMSSGARISFNDPRRFGFMDLTPSERLASYPSLRGLGPEPLSAELNAEALARACRGRKTSLKVALLDQRVVAGLGNIYVSEALHRARLLPHRPASTIATRSGEPRESAHELTAAIKHVLTSAIARVSNASYRAERFRVYDREGQRCRRRGCSGIIKRRTQAGRSTFYCPVCQR
jgi:formamidopyrimidine-DNA glycosylase